MPTFSQVEENSVTIHAKTQETAMHLGACPYCDDGIIEVREKRVHGKRVKLFACSNAHWKSEDGELWELREDATCSFRIWQNALGRYGKWLSYAEVRTLLEEEEVEVTLVSKRYGKKIEYEKKIILDREYGVSVLWDE